MRNAQEDFRQVRIVGVSSADAVYRFSMDDLTVVPIPEPSSLVALLAGLCGLGGVIWRRRIG